MDPGLGGPRGGRGRRGFGSQRSAERPGVLSSRLLSPPRCCRYVEMPGLLSMSFAVTWGETVTAPLSWLVIVRVDDDDDDYDDDKTTAAQRAAICPFPSAPCTAGLFAQTGRGSRWGDGAPVALPPTTSFLLCSALLCACLKKDDGVLHTPSPRPTGRLRITTC